MIVSVASASRVSNLSVVDVLAFDGCMMCVCVLIACSARISSLDGARCVVDDGVMANY